MPRVLILAPRRRSKVSLLVSDRTPKTTGRRCDPGTGAAHEQNAGYVTGRPHRPVEHLMLGGIVALVAASLDAQRGGYGALTRGRDRATIMSWAFRQVGMVKGARIGKVAAGRVSVAGPLVMFETSQLNLSL